MGDDSDADCRKEDPSLILMEGKRSTNESHESEEIENSDWNDPVARELQDLLHGNLTSVFSCAMKSIGKHNYDGDTARLAILRGGLPHGSNDALSNTVDKALALLRELEEGHSTEDVVTKSVMDLSSYIMLEMINAVMKVKPHLNVTEAIWRLLIYDLNLMHACGMEEDYPGHLSGEGDSVERFSFANHQPPKLDTSEVYHSASQTPDPVSYSSGTLTSPSEFSVAGTASQCAHYGSCPIESVIERDENPYPIPKGSGKLPISQDHAQKIQPTQLVQEKQRGSKKGLSLNSKKDMLRQKALHLEKGHRGHAGKGALKVKLSTLGNLVSEKNSNSEGITSVKSGETSRGQTGHFESIPPSGMGATDKSPRIESKVSESVAMGSKPTSKENVSQPISFGSVDNYAKLPYEGEGCAIINTLLSRIEELEKEIQSWTTWANDKVMQVARRLGKDPELKALKQEKKEAEKDKEEMQTIEENTAKRLSDMEHTLSRYRTEIDMANSSHDRLKAENVALKLEVEVAHLEAQMRITKQQEAVLKEVDTQKKLQACEVEKALLQEALNKLKEEAADLQHKLGKNTNQNRQMEALRKNEEREKERHERRAQQLRREKEKLTALEQDQDDKIRQSADEDLQQSKESIKKLESEISKLKSASEACRIEALRKGTSTVYSCSSADSYRRHALQEPLDPEFSKSMEAFQINFSVDDENKDFECIMCMTNEKTVVLLPCLHQVLCKECIAELRKNGNNHCPSCRTPIERQLCPLFPR